MRDRAMMVHLGPREFVRLELFCRDENKLHETGGMQGYRARWREQLDARRGALTKLERFGPTPPEDRWIDLDEASVRFIRRCLVSKKVGGWQKKVFDIFAGTPEITEMVEV